MKKLYIVRHGETVWNLEKRTQGSKDSSLTTLGISQAELLAQRLREVKLDAIYSSPLKRAYLTAEIIGNKHNIDYILDERLAEMNFGIWEGLTHTEIEKNYPNDYKIWRQEPDLMNIEKGENIKVVQKRMIDFVNNAIMKSNKETFLAISHGTTIRLFLLYILSMDLKHYYRLKQDNCAVNLVEFRPYGPVLINYNDTCHLDRIRKR